MNLKINQDESELMKSKKLYEHNTKQQEKTKENESVIDIDEYRFFNCIFNYTKSENKSLHCSFQLHQ